MTDVATQPAPVFVNQTPEYQAAMQSISVLAQNEPAFRKVVGELGLNADFERMSAGTKAMQPLAQEIQAKEQQLVEQIQQTQKKMVGDARKWSLGSIAAMGIAAVSSIIGFKNSSTKKRWLSTLGITAAVGAISGLLAATIGKFYQTGVPKIQELEFKNMNLQQAKNDLAMKAMEMQQPFANDIAARMVEKQVALDFSGPEPKLVSTAKPTPAAEAASAEVKPEAPVPVAEAAVAPDPVVPAAPEKSFAANLTPPAASKVAAVEQKAEAVTEMAR